MRRFSLASVLLLLFVLVPLAVSGQERKFLGDWEITLVKHRTKEYPPWFEIKYPIQMTIYEQDGKLNGNYIDQLGDSDGFSFVVIRENEIIFIMGGVGKKAVEQFGPVHRAILKNGVLRGFVFTDRKRFEWIGRRKKN